MPDQDDAFTFDPNSPESWEEQMDRQFRAFFPKYQAREKIRQRRRTGELQVEKGKIRAGFVQAFHDAFPKEVTEHFENRIRALRSIKGDTKFHAEVVRLMMDIYMIGLYQGAKQPDFINEQREKFFASVNRKA